MSCPVCASSSDIKLRKYRGNHTVYKGTYLYKCNNCQLKYINPMPLAADLEDYNSRYFATAHKTFKINDEQNLYFQALAESRYRTIKSFIDSSGISVCDILEIGPGFGHLALELLNNLNPAINYYGIETDISLHVNLKKIGLTLDFTNETNRYDLIVMSHVIEHLSNPIEQLNEYVHSLRSGGIVFIEVPFLDCNYKVVDEPHLLFFNSKSLEVLSNQLGLVIKDVILLGTVYKGWKLKLHLAVCSLVRFIYRSILFVERNFSLAFPSRSFIKKMIVFPTGLNVYSSERPRWIRVIAIKE